MFDGMSGSIKALLLNGPVESLNVCIVIGLPYSGMSVPHFVLPQTMSEPGGELTTMISLDHFKSK